MIPIDKVSEHSFEGINSSRMMVGETLKHCHIYFIIILLVNLTFISFLNDLCGSYSYLSFISSSFWTPTNLQKNDKLLVIFTSFKNNPNKSEIHQEVINNWLSLGNDIQPVFFYNQSNPMMWESLALHKGWIGIPLGKTNKYGTPMLKDFYATITNRIKSQFYGYCNGDILFDNGLRNTLKQILIHKKILNNSALVIGRRTNIEYQDYHTFKLSNPNYTKSLHQIANSKGILFTEWAEDYFFVYLPQHFPWDDIKDIVIGRPGYDNYLVSEAIKQNVSVIDTTNTILAAHLTGIDGNHAGVLNIDKEYNLELIGKTYDYHLGVTSRAQCHTTRDEKGRIIVINPG